MPTSPTSPSSRTPRPSSASLTDAELLRAIRDQDEGAFEAFVERYGQRLFSFGLRMCGHHEDAEDVFQETLLRAFRSLETVRDAGAVRTWLYRVVSNQCLMMRRKDPPDRQVALAELEPGEDDVVPAALLGDEEMPDDAAARAELRRRLQAAVLRLPKNLRIVLLLRDVEGLTTGETAEVLGLGLSAVKMRLSRAREKLREEL